MRKKAVNGTGKRYQVGFMIDPGVHVALKKLAKRKDQSMAWVIRRAIREYINKQESRHAPQET